MATTEEENNDKMSSLTRGMTSRLRRVFKGTSDSSSPTNKLSFLMKKDLGESEDHSTSASPNKSATGIPLPKDLESPPHSGNETAGEEIPQETVTPVKSTMSPEGEGGEFPSRRRVSRWSIKDKDDFKDPGGTKIADVGETPIIPDLDEVENEDLTTQMAAPPAVKSNRITTLRELDQGMGFDTADENGIDLAKLTALIFAPEQVFEDDKHWDRDVLFTEVTSELLKESEALESSFNVPIPVAPTSIEKLAVKMPLGHAPKLVDSLPDLDT